MQLQYLNQTSNSKGYNKAYYVKSIYTSVQAYKYVEQHLLTTSKAYNRLTLGMFYKLKKLNSYLQFTRDLTHARVIKQAMLL